jgi:hypothetical protein
MPGKVRASAALELTCSGTTRTLNVGDTLNVQMQVKNTGTQTTMFYVTAQYDTGYGTPVLMVFNWTATSIAPGVTNNFNDSFQIPADMEGKTIRLGCNVCTGSHGGFIVTSGSCDNMFTVQEAPTVAAEIVSITVS